MKKILSLVLCAVLTLSIFAFAGCGKKDDGKADGDKATAQAVKLVNINLTDEEYAFGVDKNQPELLEKTNAFIRRIMADSRFNLRMTRRIALVFTSFPVWRWIQRRTRRIP